MDGAFHLQRAWAFHVSTGNIYLMRRPQQTPLPCQQSLTPHRSSAALPNNSHGESRGGQAVTGGLPKALVMHVEFGAVSSERGENAWASAKRERDPCRGQSVSPEVSRGVNGHDCRTWGYTRSPPSFLLRLFTGCLRWLVPWAPQKQHSSTHMPHKLEQETTVSAPGRNHHLIRKPT